MKELLLFITIVEVVLCGNVNSPFDPDPDPRDPNGIPLELGKQSFSKQHLSKLRLKSKELYLPRKIVPISYKLQIRPILESNNLEEVLTAAGSVEIVVRCVERTDTIVLHAQTRGHIKIDGDTLRVHANKPLNNSHHEHSLGEREPRFIGAVGHAPLEKEEADFYQIDLSETLEVNEEYVIGIKFVSRINNDSLNGLYLSKYIDPETSVQKYLAVTQFEAIAARQMLPCFDEPDLKATFQVTISRNASLNSMSNMPLEYSRPDADKEGYILDFYPPTPPMSSYLLAIVVSDFTCATAPSSLYNKSVQACGPPHMVQKNGASHAAQVSAKILDFYEKLWLVPYPLPKMQSVAIPDFEAGAMENYGLNTYRISALIWYPETSSESKRSQVESTIAHELAHQNFGNLVTCKKWNHIFLNEGFATYVANLGQEAVSPEFHTKELGWYTEYFQVALRKDAQAEIHPVVKTEDYFGDFDAITYSKGASLIKMMESILSRETLMNGLRTYLNAFSFSNTQYTNLFDTLDTQARLEKTHPQVASMSEIMETWTIQPGFPLVRVEWVFKRLFHISQERFVEKSLARIWTDHKNNSSWSKEALEEDLSNRTNLWNCPIFISTSADTPLESKLSLWLTNRDVTKAWTIKNPVEWIVINVDSKAYFRVLYDAKLSAALEAQLDKDFTVFSPITRAQLIEDAFTCAWSQYSSVTVALGRTKFLAHEKDPGVWATSLKHLTLIYRMISEDEEAVSNFKNYMKPRVQGALDLIGVEQLSTDKGKLVLHRQSLLDWGIFLELPNVMAYAQQQVSLHDKFNYKLISVDIRSEILCGSVRGEESETFLENLYIKSNDPEERAILLKALTCSKHSEYLDKLIGKATNPEFVTSPPESYSFLQKLVSNPVSRHSTFEHIRLNFHDLLEYFGTIDYISWLIGTFAQFWSTREQLDMVKELVTKFEEEFIEDETSINATLTRIENNIIWMELHGKDIKSWFLNQNPQL